MADARVSNMRDLFTDPTTLFKLTVEETIEIQTATCYDLLRRGKDAEIRLKPTVRSKLTSTYMDLPDDPWGHPYQFYFGPLSGSVNRYIFRSFRGEDYVYNLAAYEEAINESPGAPRPDADTPPAKGFPCPGDLTVYIFCCGRNGQPDQLPWGRNGGDDINNWDNKIGWSALY
ncbi:MAG TPA: hypothetical protein VMZ06_05775 [Candidatus Bathyarchaeia archaeon]|nr:hypothetical protein [Candidatus Bathyarchaeia archaeon]